MPIRIRIAVIGAGICGLGAIRALKDEGLEPVCFEKTGHYAGLWHYHDDDTEGEASVMKTTLCNTSKEIGALSNFPPPKEYPHYLPHNLMLEYITMMVNESDVLRHIMFHHEVTSVVQSNDYQITGRWDVSTRDTRTGTINNETFDGVMICIGHHVYPNIPTFPGMETFKGRVMHSRSLKTNKTFEDERVLVIGVGSSGVDAATDISNVAKKVYLSCRRGTWVFPRVGEKGIPNDVVLLRRCNLFLKAVLPHCLVCSYSERILNRWFDHSMYNIKPNNRVFSEHPCVSDALPVQMISGKVVARRGIKTFVSNGVIFEGEKDVIEVDSVILATGYLIKFPFLSDDIVRVEDNRVKLYKHMYPPHLTHPSLVIMGLIQPSGPGIPPGEMQGRWASRVMSGKCSLPSQKEMWKDIKKKEKANKKKFINTPRHTLEVDFIEYIDELAALIGAKPNFWKMAFTDPKLFWACIMGPSLPYQYRLQGPNPWAGARNAILTYKKRERAPFGSSGDIESSGIWRKLTGW